MEQSLAVFKAVDHEVACAQESEEELVFQTLDSHQPMALAVCWGSLLEAGSVSFPLLCCRCG